MGRKRMIGLSAAVVLLFAAGTALYALTNVIREDRTPPEISLAREQIQISVTDPQEKLLEGVTATDRRDGDVSDLTVIESISKITPEHTAEVTYAAFDRSGNVAKAKAEVQFTDYRSPRFAQRQALVMAEGGSQDVLGYMTAQDVVDGDLSGHIKGSLISDTVSLSRPGAHRVEFRVTNSMGDTVRLTLPVDVYPATAFNASVSLSEYLVYIPRGAAFHGEDYLRSLNIGSMSYSLTGNDPEAEIFINRPGTGTAMREICVDMNEQVDPNVPGVYSVTYTVTMNDQYTGFTRLNVIVEE